MYQGISWPESGLAVYKRLWSFLSLYFARSLGNTTAASRKAESKQGWSPLQGRASAEQYMLHRDRSWREVSKGWHMTSISPVRKEPTLSLDSQFIQSQRTQQSKKLWRVSQIEFEVWKRYPKGTENTATFLIVRRLCMGLITMQRLHKWSRIVLALFLILLLKSLVQDYARWRTKYQLVCCSPGCHSTNYIESSVLPQGEFKSDVSSEKDWPFFKEEVSELVWYVLSLAGLCGSGTGGSFLIETGPECQPHMSMILSYNFISLRESASDNQDMGKMDQKTTLLYKIGFPHTGTWLIFRIFYVAKCLILVQKVLKEF